MPNRNNEQEWLVLTVRVPSEPSRFRVAIWRELRRAGGVQLVRGTWALPDRAASQPTVAAVRKVVADAGGDLTVLRATGHDDADRARLAALFTAAREEEWRSSSPRPQTRGRAPTRDRPGQAHPRRARGRGTEPRTAPPRHREHAPATSGAPSAAEADDTLAACEAALDRFERLVFDHLDQA